MYEYLPTPAVVVELAAVENNIKSMIGDAKKYNLKHRPHIKSHKSVELAKLQLALGAEGVTCAKLGEAEAMADGGVTDILIAYPLIGCDKMTRLGRLIERAKITTIVNSDEGAAQLSRLGQSIGKKVRVLIEIDGGVGRGGLAPYEPTLAFALKIRDLPGIDVVGALYYGGTIYSDVTREDMRRTSRQERDALMGTAELLRSAGCKTEILSGGTSFSSKLPDLLSGITELRAGHYIFNDCGQLFSGFTTEAACALRVVATVIAVVDGHHAILDAGTKSLSGDLCWRHKGYGYIIGRPDVEIEKLNEEHAFICSKSLLGFSVGDKLAIIPNHACVVCNLVDEVYGVRGGVLERKIRIDARGKSV